MNRNYLRRARLGTVPMSSLASDNDNSDSFASTSDLSGTDLLDNSYDSQDSSSSSSNDSILSSDNSSDDTGSSDSDSFDSDLDDDDDDIGEEDQDSNDQMRFPSPPPPPPSSPVFGMTNVPTNHHVQFMNSLGISM
jgi:hypothetical protein